jgi:serine phosphatase RsbU (regulator of sigma subunit)/anti-sigma regulatory factor (Ser/Thr protein kinase)
VVGGAQVAAAAVGAAEPPLPGRAWATWAAELLLTAMLAGLALVFLYFPDGRLPSRRWRVVIWLLALALGALAVSVTFGHDLPGNPDIANPAGVDPPGGPRLYAAAYGTGWWLLWAGIVATAASLVARFVRARGEQRQQLKWLTYAACLLMTLSAVATVAYLLGSEELTVVTGAGMLAIPIAVWIAIRRHRLYDIDLLINRTLIYGVVTFTLGLAFTATVLVLGLVMGGDRDFAIAAATLAVTVAFRPVRSRVQEAVDRRFNRHKYDAARTIAAFSARLRQQVNLDTLTADLVAVADQTMQPTAVSLWLQPLDGKAPAKGIAADDPLLPRFQAAGGAMDVDALEVASPALADLRASGIRLVVPLVSQGELAGLLGLGPRRSEQPYSADDHTLLNNLAGHAAPAVRLAQLVRKQEEEVRERERIDQELRVAQLIQQQFLPREPPDLPGWQVAALYRPARAVGGDFYDFIALPEGRLGIVVGDVSGKGVPAALVMATTHAILRAEAPDLIAPARVLERVNDLMQRETFEHMFVTCLYAVLDHASGQLRFANAGHNPPYLRGEAGAIELRATGMPLGLLPDMRYEEKSAIVAPGDDLLLYSDGLTEAHGAGREMFGFPRLASLLADGPGGKDLIDLLLRELRGFTGSEWEQEDDITLVTLRRTPGERVLTQFDVASVAGNERVALDRVTAAVGPLGLPQAKLDQLKTAVAEAVMNAIEHGNANDPRLPVTVRAVVHRTDLLVQIVDQGGGRSIPEPVPPDLEAKLAGEQSARGWGLFLIKSMVDELRVTDDDRHHMVELVMHLDGADVARG